MLELNLQSLSKKDLIIHQNSIEFIKKNKKNLINRFCNPKIYKSSKKPISIFMADSSGSGKTEFSQNLISLLKNEKIVRIDADEIREFIPEYNGHNSYLIQRGASLGVEKIFDHATHKNLNFILDGTFAHYNKAYENVTRCLKKGRRVEIYYVYQNPIIAWNFVKKREKIEHRNVPKEFFNFSFRESKENVKKIMKEFKYLIKINIVIKDHKNQTKIVYRNVKSIDKYLEKYLDKHVNHNYTNAN